MIVILLLSVPIIFMGLRLQSKNKKLVPETFGSKGIAKERLMRDKSLKREDLVAISKKRYHRVGCRYADSEASLYSIAKAKEKRLVACKVCRP